MVPFIGQLQQVFQRVSREPLFAVLILITVAIGVGADTVIFSVVEGVLLKPLPYKAPDRLIGVWYKAPEAKSFVNLSTTLIPAVLFAL